ncbi:MAG TPA: hypothetical protein EYP21_02685 [Syntrophaceae bacterium]|nr:hypothetical protein [Syntrophaceae bacterium]
MYQRLKGLQDPLRLTLINSKNKDLFLQFEDYCQSLIKYSQKLALHYDLEPLEAYPAIRLDSNGSKGNIYYFALPRGEEEAIFIETLLLLSKREASLPRETVLELKHLKKEVSIKTMISGRCPHCASAVALANKVAIASPKISSQVYDVSLFPEVARKYQVTAAPTVIIQDDYFLVGSQTKDKLIEWVGKAARAQYDAEVYKAILKEARAQELIERFLKEKEIPRNFLDLLLDPEWPARLGVMVVLESISQEKPVMIKNVMTQLLELFERTEEREKGDIIFLLGLIGDETILPNLENIARGKRPVLREIALEAIQTIKGRWGKVH